MRRRRWLVVAPAFNCDGEAASYVCADRIPFLEAADIEIEVIGAMRGAPHDRLSHRRVWPWSPSGFLSEYRLVVAKRHGRGLRYQLRTAVASILLTPAMLVERAITGLPGHWSWAPAAAFQAWRLHRRNAIELIYSSGGPSSAHLAGWIAHKLTGAPWVAEMHDPIVASDEHAAGSRRTLPNRRRRLERWLEARVCNDATAAWWFTEAALAAARRRCPTLADRGFSVTPGGPPPSAVEGHEYGSQLQIGYFGTVSRTRSLEPFLLGLNRWFERRPEARAVVRLHIYGSDLDPRAKLVEERFGLRGVIICHGRLSHDPVTGESSRMQVGRRMQQCDALLLLHGNDPSCAEYIPSKSYDYFWARRPVLALPHLNPQLEELVRRFGGILPPRVDPDGIADAIEVMWAKWTERILEPSDARPIGVDAAAATILRRVSEATSAESCQRTV